MSSRLIRGAVTVVALATFAAACSGGSTADKEPEPTAEPTPTEGPTPADGPAPSGGPGGASPGE